MYNRVNKYYKISNNYLSLILVLISAVAFSGCIQSSENKTIVIHEENEKKEFLQEEELNLKIKNIYSKHNYDEYRYKEIIGWVDNQNILECVSDYGEEVLNIANYKYNFNSDVMSFEIRKYDFFKLSPNGKKLIYNYCDNLNNKEKIIIRDLESNSEKVIYECDYLGDATKAFSENSKYVFIFIPNNFTIMLNKIIVYDVDNGDLIENKVKDLDNIYKFSYAHISNDGKKVLVIGCDKEEDWKPKLYSVNLDKDIIKNNDKRKLADLSNNIELDMIDDNRAAFIISKNNNLCIYDDKTDKISNVDENVGTFKISNNRKYIIYSKKEKNNFNIYCGKLQGNNIVSSTLVYTNFKPSYRNIFWSMDDKKVIVGGRKHIEKKYNNLDASEVEQYIIIEFK